MADINLSLKTDSSDLTKIKLENLDLSNKVEYIQTEIKNRTKINKDFVFVHCGSILNKDDTLSNAGISSGATIHCLNKHEPPAPIILTPLKLLEVQQLIVSIRTTVNNSGFRAFIQKIRTPDMIEKIIKACPFVHQDPSALTFLQDADLFQSLSTPSELNKIIEKRPTVGHLVQYLTTLISNDGNTATTRSHHVSYSLDALSDEEEEMEAEQSGDSAGGSRASGSMSYQPITPGQLAAALANATGSGGGGTSRNSRSIPTTPSSAATPFNTPGPPSASDGPMSSPGPITSEMFSQALQNAFAASASSGTGSSLPLSSNAGSGLGNLEESLQLMREMGIGDEQLSLQALQATNGDVEAAVNYIFAQLLADD